MAIIVGSARHDEHGNCYKNGCAGDQLQKSDVNDMAGEVSMQTMYVHSKGWYVLRPISDAVANALASGMRIACNNKHIGYDQNNRLGVINFGINTKTDTECDCSSLVRACCKYAGFDTTNFTTTNEKSVLLGTKKFTDMGSYTSGMKLYVGDVLVTKTQGHTVIVVEGSARGTVATPKPTIASGNPIIKKGSKGIQVKYLQQDLNYLGFKGKDGKVLSVDGDAGTNTDYAIRQYQTKYKLSVDGKYGPSSEKKMKSLI